MSIFDILNNLYTSSSSKWIADIDEKEISPYIIQQFLIMNDNVRVQTRWLDKYVFVLPPKMYLSLAWTVIPKVSKTPFNKFIKKIGDEEEFSFILDLIRKHYELSDNDYKANRNLIIKQIKSDMVYWFRAYGIPKGYWKKYELDFNDIKFDEKVVKVKDEGLNKWGF